MRRKAMMRLASVLLPATALLAGVVAAGGQREGKLTGSQIEEMLKSANLKYISLGQGAERNAFLLPFESKNCPDLAVVVALSEKGDFVSIFSRIMDVPDDAPASFYRHLLMLNERIWQAKFALSKEGALFFEFEIPSRLLDARELVEDIYATAQFVDKTYPTLQKLLAGEEPEVGPQT